MNVLWLALGSIADSLSGVVKKFHKKPCSIFFSGIACLSIVIMFYIMAGFRFEMHAGLWTFSILYGIFYGLSAICSTLALKTGDLTLSALFISFSGLLPSVFNIFAHSVIPKTTFYFGIIFFILCLLFTNVKFGNKNKAQAKNQLNLIWLITLVLTVVCNGGSMIVIGEQQLAFNNAYQNEFMIIGGLIATAVCFLGALILERGKIRDGIIGTLLIGGSMGVLSGLYNLAYIMLVATVSLTLLAPTLMVLSLLVSFLIGLIVYREKYTLLQYLGLVLGVVSVILLNI